MTSDRMSGRTSRVMRRPGSVRGRTTTAAVLVVALALLAGAIAFLAVLRHTLTAEVETAARLRAAELAASLATSGELPSELVVGDPEEQLVQVVDGTGAVVASSANVRGLPQLASPRPGDVVRIAAPVGEGPFVLVAAPVAPVADPAEPTGPRGSLTVLVGRTLEDVGELTRLVATLLGVGLPVLLGLVTLIVWRAVGRALEPVDAITREVDEISAAELHRRVPDPAGTDEISRLALTMNRMLARLQAATERQRRFISDASHELRSPVASIRTQAEVALAHPAGTDAREVAATVLVEIQRVQRLVADLLVLARADEGSLELHRQPVDLDDLVFEEAARLRTESRLQVDTATVTAARVLADAKSLRQVLRNLGDNAARHARERIAFELGMRDGRVLLGVEDDGPGIPATDRERVFDRFVRLDDARDRDGGGSGLGLAIVAELVEAAGGSVTVSDGRLGGARFEVSLPAA